MVVLGFVQWFSAFTELVSLCFNLFSQTFHMAPKKRPHAESSSSQPAYDQTRFPSLGKANQFNEQFRSRSVESEREVAEELHDKLVFRSLATRNWFPLVTFHSKQIYVDWVREFYNNMEIQDSGNLKTYVRGKWITISASDLADFIDIPEVENPDYPIPANTQIDYDLVGLTICGEPTAWPGGLIPHGNLTDEYRFLNRFVCHNLEPRGHTSDVAQKNGYLLYCIGTGRRVNIPQIILNAIVRTLSAKKNSILPFGVLISEFLAHKGVPKKSSDVLQKIRNPINSRTLTLSTSHVQHAQGDEAPGEAPAPAAPVQGEQQGPPNQVAQLAADVQGLRVHMDERFNRIDETLAAILARLGPPQ